MGAIVASILVGLIDPFLWIKSMSTLAVNKSKIKYVGICNNKGYKYKIQF